MDRRIEQKIREHTGKGPLYEVMMYNGKIDRITTKKQDFRLFHSPGCITRYPYVVDVSSNKESAVVSELRSIFGDEAKIVLFVDCPEYVGFLQEGSTVFCKTDENHAITDTSGDYIVCQPKKKKLVLDKYQNLSYEENAILFPYSN